MATEELEAAQAEYLMRVHSTRSVMPGAAAPDALLTNGERGSGLARANSMADGSWPGCATLHPRGLLTGPRGVCVPVSLAPLCCSPMRRGACVTEHARTLPVRALHTHKAGRR